MLELDGLIDNKWRVLKTFEESGQGQSAIVSSSIENSENQYVIKVLKNTHNSNNISRFESEIELLKRLHEIDRVPSIIDENMEQYYYVMDYIDGKSMENAIQSKENRKNFDKALTAIMTLLDIVNEYSKLKIIHRDIKPANIICKNGDIEDIYLIDFGIGHDLNKAEDLTEANIQLGNRFLRLPELQNGNKRDIRSDITMCVGILYFLLTGSSPVSLIDEKQRMPHQTEKGIAQLQWIGNEKLKILNKIFDKGFQNNIEERYQNVSDLIFALNEINLHKVSDAGKETYSKKTDSFCFSTIKSILEKPNIQDRIRYLRLYDNRAIAIGNGVFSEIEDKLFIHFKNDSIFKAIGRFRDYQCEKIDGLFIRKNVLIDEILMKQDNISEIVAKIHFENNYVRFDNFSIQNSLYEIPVKRFLDPFMQDTLKCGAKKVICNNEKIIFLNDSEYAFLDLEKKRFQKVDLSGLFKSCKTYMISNDLQWIVYTDNGEVHIAKKEEETYVKQEISDFDFLQYKIMDYTFYGNELLLLLKDKLILFDIEKKNITKKYCIKENFLINKVNRIHFASPLQDIVILKNDSNRKLYFHLTTGRCSKDNLGENLNYILSSDNKNIYRSDYCRLTKEKITDGTLEVIYDVFEKGDFNDKDFDLKTIKYKHYNYYFSLIYDGDYVNNKKRKIRVYKIIDKQWVRICEIEDRASIKDFWIFRGRLITIDEDNHIICWKMNN